MLSPMAGIRGKSGPPANQNAFKHGLAGISQRANGALTSDEQAIREDILGDCSATRVVRRASARLCACWPKSLQATCRYWSRLTRQLTAASRTIRKPGKIPKRWLNWMGTGGLPIGESPPVRRCKRDPFSSNTPSLRKILHSALS